MLNRKFQSGFNLIELAVVVAILGFALVAVMPSISDWMQNLGVRNAAEAVKGGVERARQEALRRNADMTFWLVNDSEKSLTNACVLSNVGPSWVVSKLNPEGKCGAAPSNVDDPRIAEKWSARQGAASIAIEVIDGAGNSVNSITFNSLGRPEVDRIVRLVIGNSAGTARSLELRVDQGGSIRLCDPQVSSTDTRACGALPS